jgi:hypothetical protein
VNPNDFWYYRGDPVHCEGVDIISIVLGDTLLGGQVYAICELGPPFSGSYLRADSSRVYEYDTSSHSEYVVLDFNANAGDTICFRGSKIIVALGNMRFDVGQRIITVRDSVGIVFWHDSLCWFTLLYAWINGHLVPVPVMSADQNLPVQPLLEQNYPNPFNPQTSFRFFVPAGQIVSVAVYDCLGQETETLFKGHASMGWHTLQWNANGHPSGVYFYVLRTRQSIMSRKLILLQ